MSGASANSIPERGIERTALRAIADAERQTSESTARAPVHESELPGVRPRRLRHPSAGRLVGRQAGNREVQCDPVTTFVVVTRIAAPIFLLASTSLVERPLRSLPVEKPLMPKHLAERAR